MAKIEKLKSGTYRTRVYVGKDNSGKPVYKSLTDTDKDRLRQTAAEYRFTHRNKSISKSSRTLGDAMESYITLKKPVLSPSTIRGYSAVQNVFKAEFKALYDKKLQNLDDATLQKVANKLYETRSAKTVENYIGLINTVLKNNRYPELIVTIPAKKPYRVELPDIETMKKLTKAAEGTRLDIPIHLAIMGLRRSEICALAIEDLKDNVLCIHSSVVYGTNKQIVRKEYPKTPGSYRYIRIPEALSKKIKEAGVITKMNPNSLTNAFRRFVKSNGLPDMRLHDCRHFMASYLHDQGVSDAEIMRMGGWKTDHVMKNVYRHAFANDEKAKEIADQYADF